MILKEFNNTPAERIRKLNESLRKNHGVSVRQKIYSRDSLSRLRESANANLVRIRGSATRFQLDPEYAKFLGIREVIDTMLKEGIYQGGRAYRESQQFVEETIQALADEGRDLDTVRDECLSRCRGLPNALGDEIYLELIEQCLGKLNEMTAGGMAMAEEETENLEESVHETGRRYDYYQSGPGITLVDHHTGQEAFLQGDDAAQFMSDLHEYDEANPDTDGVDEFFELYGYQSVFWNDVREGFGNSRIARKAGSSRLLRRFVPGLGKSEAEQRALDNEFNVGLLRTSADTYWNGDPNPDYDDEQKELAASRRGARRYRRIATNEGYDDTPTLNDLWDQAVEKGASKQSDNKLDFRERIAFHYGNMSSQVYNGGFQQWIENGYYSDHVVSFLLDLMHEIATPAAREMIDVLEEVDHIFAGLPSVNHFFSDEDDQEEADTAYTRMYALDDRFYEFGDQLDKDVEAFVVNMQTVTESVDLSEAEVIMAARAMSGAIADQIEKIGRMVNEDLVAIADQLAKEMDADTAAQFSEGMSAVLNTHLESARSTKDQVDELVTTLAQGGSFTSDYEAEAGLDGDDFDLDIDPDLDDEEIQAEPEMDAEAEPGVDPSQLAAEPLGRGEV
jgi:hypothetical protein